MLGSITRDPIFCSKARILLQVKKIVFMSLMITKRLLDVVSCEFKKKMFKERRSRGSTEGPVKFSYTGPSVRSKKGKFHWDDLSQHSLRFHSLFNVRVIFRLKYEISSYL
jgi:hypothetical protein